jgi:hypothetical protein
MPAVRTLQQHRAIPLARILRSDRKEVRRELDRAVLQIDRIRKVDDPLVTRAVNTYRKVNTTSDALVRANITKRFSIEDILARGDVDANNTRVERKNVNQSAEQSR